MLLAAGCAWADAPFTVSVNGTEVTDGRTGLVWRRCAEGMAATAGSCTGTASTFTHEQAMLRARDQATSTGVAWRLPNVKELASIVDRSKIDLAVDMVAFPATPANWFWSSSPNVGGGYLSSLAWNVYFGSSNVDFGSGVVSYSDRYNPLHVRLVRTGQ